MLEHLVRLFLTEELGETPLGLPAGGTITAGAKLAAHGHPLVGTHPGLHDEPVADVDTADGANGEGSGGGAVGAMADGGFDGVERGEVCVVAELDRLMRAGGVETTDTRGKVYSECLWCDR